MRKLLILSLTKRWTMNQDITLSLTIRGSTPTSLGISLVVVIGLLWSKSTMETVPYHFQFVVLRSKQCRLWLMRSMREWQSLPHAAQMCVDVAESVVGFSFRLVLFSMASLVIFLVILVYP